MKKDEIIGTILVIGMYTILAYFIFAGIYYRFADPTNTETEILLEIITFGDYER